MATAASVTAKIQNLIGTANATTGNADTDLTTAIGSLIAGYGTGGGSGGLPTGITALTSGTFTPASDVSSTYKISHGLGVRPNFFMLIVEGQEILKSADFAYYITHEFGLAQDFINNQAELEAFRIYRYSNGTTFSQGAAVSLISQFADTTTFSLYASATYNLKAGVTYRWIAGVLDGL